MIQILKLLLSVTVLVPILNSAPLSKDYEGLRLIQMDEAQPPEWMTDAEILRLIQKNRKFMDITEGQLLQVTNSQRSFAKEFPTSPTHGSFVWPMIGNISTHRMKNFLQEFTAFHTRYFKSATGAEAARWLLSELQYIAKKSSHNSANISIKTFENPWGQFSIIARLYPRTQNDRLVVQRSAPTSFFSTDHNDDNSIPTVILGAHLDSINQWNPWFGRAPGADDDGSGTAALVEVFRLLVTHNFKPQRPVELHFYSAEEGGLLGSQRIAADYAKLQVPVFSMYQIDMTGFVPPNKAPIIGVATDNVSIELAKVIKVLVKTYCSIESADVQCGYGCSDHYSWFKTGVDAVFTFEASFQDHSPYIHTSEDVVEKIDLRHITEFAKVMLAYAVEMSWA